MHALRGLSGRESITLHRTGCPHRAGRLVVARTESREAAAAGSSRRVSTAAATAAPPARDAASSGLVPNCFDAWEAQLPQWSSSTPKPQRMNADDAKKLGAAVAAAAVSYVPKPKLSVPSIDELPDDLPVSLHERMELIAKVQLQGFLQDPALEPTELAFTTTDITAALQVAGAIVNGKRGREAVVSFVACETERQMTWSRLEGLNLHWACSRAAGGAWELPPRGWKTLPESTTDAGGAWNSLFEKHPMPGPALPGQPPEPVYTLLMTVPLEGPLEKGGLTFVLKGGGAGATTKWLKDATTKKDFFVDLQKLVAAKAAK